MMYTGTGADKLLEIQINKLQEEPESEDEREEGQDLVIPSQLDPSTANSRHLNTNPPVLGGGEGLQPPRSPSSNGSPRSIRSPGLPAGLPTSPRPGANFATR